MLLMRNMPRLSQNKPLYLFSSLALNAAAVILHELGHALFYIMQGIRVHLTLVSAKPLSGMATIPGLLGGFVLNASTALLFLILYLRSPRLVYFLIVLANTFFARILFYLFAFLARSFPYDEIQIAGAWHTEPWVVSLCGMGLMLAILIPALLILRRHTNTKQRRIYLSLSFLGGILSLLGVAALGG